MNNLEGGVQKQLFEYANTDKEVSVGIYTKGENFKKLSRCQSDLLPHNESLKLSIQK